MGQVLVVRDDELWAVPSTHMILLSLIAMRLTIPLTDSACLECLQELWRTSPGGT